MLGAILGFLIYKLFIGVHGLHDECDITTTKLYPGESVSEFFDDIFAYFASSSFILFHISISIALEVKNACRIRTQFQSTIMAANTHITTIITALQTPTFIITSLRRHRRRRRLCRRRKRRRRRSCCRERRSQRVSRKNTLIISTIPSIIGRFRVIAEKWRRQSAKMLNCHRHSPNFQKIFLSKTQPNAFFFVLFSRLLFCPRCGTRSAQSIANVQRRV